MGSAARCCRAVLTLPPTGRPSLAPSGLADLGSLLSGADRIEVAHLLNGSDAFRRSFRPVCSVDGLAEVVIWGDGEQAGVELVPRLS
jgi:hypothetical protein